MTELYVEFRISSRLFFSRPSSHLPAMYLESAPHAVAQLSIEGLQALVFLLVPTTLLYSSILAHIKGHYKTYSALTVLSIASFWACPWLTPIICGPIRCLQNFASMIRPLGACTLLILENSRHRDDEATGYLCSTAQASCIHGSQGTTGRRHLCIHNPDRAPLRVLYSQPHSADQGPGEFFGAPPASASPGRVCHPPKRASAPSHDPRLRGPFSNLHYLDVDAAGPAVQVVPSPVRPTLSSRQPDRILERNMA